MKSLFDTLDFDKKRIFHNSNRHLGFFFIKVVSPLILYPLCKLRIINYVEQKKDINFRPLPEWHEQRGILPFLRYVSSDFFQSETFFDRTVLSELHIKEKYIAEARQFVSSVPKNYEKVFVHIRRGDYLKESFEGERGIDLPKSYFNKAINIIKKEIDAPFFIFLSDDTSYVESCFKEVKPKIISKNSREVDLAIMTICEAGIISNSSYSWWGAYLMRIRRKIIAPKYWYGWKKKVESHIGIQPTFSEVIEFTE
jgi:hypothetical protein